MAILFPEMIQQKIAKKLSVDKNSVSRWLSCFRKEGFEGLSNYGSTRKSSKSNLISQNIMNIIADVVDPDSESGLEALTEEGLARHISSQISASTDSQASKTISNAALPSEGIPTVQPESPETPNSESEPTTVILPAEAGRSSADMLPHQTKPSEKVSIKTLLEDIANSSRLAVINNPTNVPEGKTQTPHQCKVINSQLVINPQNDGFRWAKEFCEHKDKTRTSGKVNEAADLIEKSMKKNKALSYRQLWRIVCRNFNVKISYSWFYTLLTTVLKTRLVVPRPFHYRKSWQKTIGFKQNLAFILSYLAGEMQKPVVLLALDEVRFGLNNSLARVVTLRGKKPKAQKSQQRKYFNVCGIFDISTGDHIPVPMTGLKADNFNDVLEIVAAEYEDCEVILMMDNAQYHKAKSLVWPENLQPLYQPPYSPELNPSERVWLEAKRFLKNQVFESLKQLKDWVFEKALDIKNEQMASIVGFKWIREAMDRSSVNWKHLMSAPDPSVLKYAN